MQNPLVLTPAWRRMLTVVAVAVAAGLILWWIGEHIPRTMAIFLIAAFIAFGVRPVVLILENRKVPKPLAITIVYVALFLIAAIGLIIVVPLTVEQAQSLLVRFPDYSNALTSWVASLEDYVHQHFPSIQLPPPSINLSAIRGSQETQLATGTLASLASIALTTFTGLFVAFSSIVLSFFFLVNDDQIGEGFAQIFPQRRRANARKVATEVSQSFGSYVAGQIVVSGITAVVVAGLSALIGFRFSLILGIITFIGYSVPVIGMLVAEVIAVALCLPQGLWMVLWIQVIMFGMARVSDNVLVPKIMGESVGVSPIVVMLAVFAGGELFGLPGLLLGIPAAALIKILWKYFVSPWMRLQLDGPDANATTVTTATATATTTTTTAN